jgi:uncharacterized membrane protein
MILTLLMWANVDLLRFLIERKTPGLGEYFGVCCGYSLVWILAGLVRQPVGELATRLQAPRETSEAHAQGGAAITGQQAVQNP